MQATEICKWMRHFNMLCSAESRAVPWAGHEHVLRLLKSHKSGYWTCSVKNDTVKCLLFPFCQRIPIPAINSKQFESGSFPKDHPGSQTTPPFSFSLHLHTSRSNSTIPAEHQKFHSNLPFTKGRYFDLTGALLMNSPCSRKQPGAGRHRSCSAVSRNSWKQRFGPLPKEGWKALKALLALSCHVFSLDGIHSTPIIIQLLLSHLLSPVQRTNARVQLTESQFIAAAQIQEQTQTAILSYPKI